MQRRGADGTLHRFRVGVAIGLGDGFLAKLFYTAFGVAVLGVLQLDDVAVLHVGIDFEHRAEEDIDISRLRILLGDGAVEAVLGGHGQGEAVDKRLALLFVALRGVLLQAVGDVAEVGLPVAAVGQLAGEFILLVVAEAEVGLVVGTQQVGIELFLHYEVGDGKLGLAFVQPADGEHAEVVEQADEVIGIRNARGREAVLQFASDEALADEGLDDGSVVGKLLILADEHTQLLVVDANVALYHAFRSTAIVNVVFDEVEHHVGVVHRGVAVAFLCEAVIIIPRFHHLYQLVHGVVEGAVPGVVGEHLAHLLFGEAHHLVELWREGVVGADVESRGEVVHRDGADAGDEAASDAGVGTGLHLVEEGAQVAFAVGLVGVAHQAFGAGEDGVGEVIVLVDEEVQLLSGFLANLAEGVELTDGIGADFQFLHSVGRQQVGVFPAEELEHDAAVRVQSLAVVAQLAGDAGEVEVEHEVGVALRRGVRSDVEAGEEGVELITGAHVVVVLQQVHRKALAEAAGADEEEEAVCFFDQGDEVGFVYVVGVIAADKGEVHHPVGDAATVGEYQFFHCCML